MGIGSKDKRASSGLRSLNRFVPALRSSDTLQIDCAHCLVILIPMGLARLGLHKFAAGKRATLFVTACGLSEHSCIKDLGDGRQ
jgi:hypothetical protein